MVASRLDAGWMVAGWMVAGRQVVGWMVSSRMVAGRQVVGWMVSNRLVAGALTGLPAHQTEREKNEQGYDIEINKTLYKSSKC